MSPLGQRCGGAGRHFADRARRWLVGGAVGLAATLSGCADDGPLATSPPADAQPVEIAGLTATLEQYREDEIQGFISVKTSNQSTSTVHFEDLRLEWPGIAATEPHVRSTRMSPGVTFDIRVVQGAATCGEPPRADGIPPVEPAAAVGMASIDGAAPVLVTAPIDDVRSILPKVYARSCRDQRLTWAADLRFGDSWTESTTESGQPAVLGTIELRRRASDEPLTVTEINGSVLLRITAASPAVPVARLDAGVEAMSIPIVVEQSGNCAPHALIESKKTFIIPIGFAVGDDEPAAYVISFDNPARQLLNAMINESCGLG